MQWHTVLWELGRGFVRPRSPLMIRMYANEGTILVLEVNQHTPYRNSRRYLAWSRGYEDLICIWSGSEPMGECLTLGLVICHTAHSLRLALRGPSKREHFRAYTGNDYLQALPARVLVALAQGLHTYHCPCTSGKPIFYFFCFFLLFCNSL